MCDTSRPAFESESMKAAPSLALLLMLFGIATAEPISRPNIVWIIVEDMSANFGCYGETTIETPNVDQMAAEGVKFTNAIVTAPVCSTCRSAFITGMYQTSIGSHHHRSGRGPLKIKLPRDVVPVPKLFKDAGYHVTNLSTENFIKAPEQLEKNARVKVAKTDYNFEWDTSAVRDRSLVRAKTGAAVFLSDPAAGWKAAGQGKQSQLAPAGKTDTRFEYS